jgi:hypothetical protein
MNRIGIAWGEMLEQPQAISFYSFLGVETFGVVT